MLDADLTFEELEKNAVKAGLCNYEEFTKNPQKWKDKFFGRSDDFLSMLDNGSKRLNGAINRIEYRFMNYKIKTTEELDRVVRDYGFSSNDLIMKPEFMNCVAGKGDLIIRVITKEDAEKRKNWR